MCKKINYKSKFLSLSLLLFLLINFGFGSYNLESIFSSLKSGFAGDGVLMGEEEMVAGVLMSFDNHFRLPGKMPKDLYLPVNNIGSKSGVLAAKRC